MHTKLAVIAGAVTNDWFTFPFTNTKISAPSSRKIETNIALRKGGVGFLTKLMDHIAQAHEYQVLGPSLERLKRHNDPGMDIHSIVDLIPDPPPNGLSYRIERSRLIPNRSYWQSPDIAESGIDLLVLADAANGFRDIKNGLDLLQKARPRYIIYQMANPLGTGDLWDSVRHGPLTDGRKHDPHRLVVVINADSLRAEGIELSRGLSWEKAAEDFVRRLGFNGRLDTLVTCANLIVRFGCDGVIHHRGRDATAPTLFFDPERVEGDFKQSTLGHAKGLTTAFVAGLATGLANDGDFETGIRLGFAAARRLAEIGFVPSNEDEAPDYPVEMIAQDLVPDQRLAVIHIPSAQINAGSSRSILEQTMGDPAEIARHIVQTGPSTALTGVPIARFGRLTTADRREIESFRAITNLLEEYLVAPQVRPLCIGIFGPRGSGKGYAARQVAEAAVKGTRLRKLEFDFS
ncbi:MAG: hypothetical protein M1816_007681 [Peltula sp. TS41687]|nr:MAG: hypothetical protein M1816_007681 [Peltula sp. TS41687]